MKSHAFDDVSVHVSPGRAAEGPHGVLPDGGRVGRQVALDRRDRPQEREAIRLWTRGYQRLTERFW